MNAHISDLRRLLSQWRAEHGSVAGRAYGSNLERLRWICPLIAVINAVHAIVFLVQLVTGHAQGAVYQWTLWLCFLHALMCVAMVGFGMGASRLLRKGSVASAPALTWLAVVVCMAFALAIVTVDQWVTPNITPYLVGCVLCGMALLIRPFPSAWLYGLSYAVFYHAMGTVQDSSAQLLSNRLNGLSACALGWVMSVMLWRKFTAISLQQDQLARANAELQNKQRDLERLTRQDGLTGLFNRNTFVELTKQELDRAQRQGSATSILLLDLDHFKLINDTWGHPAGDAVLRNVALVASATVRSTDLVGRLGGEEFMVLLPGTTVDAARKLAEKLRQRLQASPTPWESASITATASIGLAGTTAAEKRPFDVLYHDADKALYLAKLRGRNRVEP